MMTGSNLFSFYKTISPAFQVLFKYKSRFFIAHLLVFLNLSSNLSTFEFIVDGNHCSSCSINESNMGTSSKSVNC